MPMGTTMPSAAAVQHARLQDLPLLRRNSTTVVSSLPRVLSPLIQTILLRSYRSWPEACSVVLGVDSTLKCFYICHAGIGITVLFLFYPLI
ncbi:hypothetical protein PVAP13_3NG087804 [Panicum virgatum]|uniref:Uncharacterized protein n=1 Tax=Panicum virgatum TaxID=38727 RepID=A0A8T0U9S2_PANVG|nr:hypothetical protein PVAP13_3NG087804 [Panicum virgatum]